MSSEFLSSTSVPAAPADQAAADRLLLAILSHVPFDGWSDAAISAGARELGIAPEAAFDRLPGGLRGLAAAFSAWADRAMLAVLAADGVVLSDLRVRERIETVVFARFMVLEPHREAVRAALGFLALPTNADLALSLTARSADAIWRHAGDRSADFSYYTKRGLLAAVVAATTLYWLDDRSAGLAATRRFLRARIADVIGIQALRRQLRGLASELPDPVLVLRRTRDAWKRAAGS